MTIHVLIADQSTFSPHPFGALFEARDDIRLAGHVSQIDELHALLPHCDVALINARLQGTKTTDLIHDLRGRYEEVKLIIMGVADVPAQIVRYLEAGAAGYILENECRDKLLSKLRMAVDGQALLSENVAFLMMKRIHKLAKTQNGKKNQHIPKLTPRQREVIELLNKGLTNREIADTLYIECGTVKNHVHRILKKLNVSSRHEAASIYRQWRPATQSPAG